MFSKWREKKDINHVSIKVPTLFLSGQAVKKNPISNVRQVKRLELKKDPTRTFGKFSGVGGERRCMVMTDLHDI